MKENKTKAYLKSHRRLLTGLFHIIFIAFLGLLLDRTLTNFVFKKTSFYVTNESAYQEHFKEYERYQDDYQIYVYDENGNRVVNRELTEEQENAFKNDNNVNKTYKNIVASQQTLIKGEMVAFAISISVASLIYMTFSEILFAGKGIGEIIYHFSLKKGNGDNVSFPIKILYGFLKWVFVYLLGILTITIVPILMIKHIIYDDKHQTLLDKKMDIECIVDEKYIAD